MCPVEKEREGGSWVIGRYKWPFIPPFLFLYDGRLIIKIKIGGVYDIIENREERKKRGFFIGVTTLARLEKRSVFVNIQIPSQTNRSRWHGIEK